ncbi:MAG TPA: hypothetical protein HPP76_04770 [Desulfuromonadales bacterium]|nr:hypothetical protein [Desulfuromonadales bacterium]
MDYFFYNTDSRAIIDKPRPRFGVLIDRKFAAVGGDRKKFGEQLGKLFPEDILLMYENLVGIVAVGRVMECWDEVSHGDSLYYTKREMQLLTGGAFEYRIAVDWFMDLSHSPFSVQQLRQLLGYPGEQSAIYSAHNATDIYEGVGALPLKPDVGARPLQRHQNDVKQIILGFLSRVSKSNLEHSDISTASAEKPKQGKFRSKVAIGDQIEM